MAKNVSNIGVIKSALWAILVSCTILEMVIFPSLSNGIGCAVTLVATWLYFKNVLNIEIIRQRPIAFIASLQLFFFMFLPLPVTLLDGNEMSHDLFIPNETYLLQLFYFSLIMLAFHLSGKTKKENRVYLWLKKMGYFITPTDKYLWILGLIGIGFRLVLMTSQGTEEKIAGAGTLGMFANLIYSPICILFNPLLGKEKCSKKTRNFVFGYIAVLVVVFISTNSRSTMLSPLVIFAFLYLIQQIYTYRKTLWLSYKRVILAVVAILAIAGPASDMAIAMVVVRGERTSVSFDKLLELSIEAFQDKERLNAYRKMAEERDAASVGAEWQESYVSSPFLDRLCNYRVIDATIYHAQRAEYANSEMLDFFVDRLKVMFPGPIVNFFFPEADKTKLNYSSMDKLYSLSANGGLGGFKVGGDVGLGLATFGYFYFILCFVIYYLVFYLLDGVARFTNGKLKISVFTMISVYFTYFLLFQVGGGMISQTTFLLWGFWWVAFWHAFAYKVVRLISGGVRN